MQSCCIHIKSLEEYLVVGYGKDKFFGSGIVHVKVGKVIGFQRVFAGIDNLITFSDHFVPLCGAGINLGIKV